MSKKLKIDQRDQLRVLLTDLLPLEVPLRFSLERCYRLLKTPGISEVSLRIVLNAGSFATGEVGPFIPFISKIRLGENKIRELGLFHPHLLVRFANFYQRYSDVIVSQCRKSTWSVRHPAAVAKTYRPRLVFSEEAPIGAAITDIPGPEILSEIQSNQSTYFSYLSYRFYYEFLQSKEIEDLEIRFSKCKKIDVAKCFHNIYTHSISWATKSKPLAKLEKNAKSTFDSEFDSLMRASNDGETHGILVGPEVSRIFAELILQQIDVDASLECERIAGKETFTVRRYLDDYHIYCNDDAIADQIRGLIMASLAKYKLYLNEAKEDNSTRPFITNLSLCKEDIRERVGDFSRQMQVSPARKMTLSLYSEIRRIVKSHGVTYSETSGYILSSVHFGLCHVLDQSASGSVSSEEVEQAMHEALNAAFTVFALDPRFRNSIWVNRIVLKCVRTLKMRSELSFSISDRVRAEVQRLLAQVWNDREDDQIEIANILSILREVPDFGRLPDWFLSDVCLEASSKGSERNYFWFVTMIDVLSLDESYDTFRQKVINCAISRITSCSEIRRSTEIFMLALDLIACPHLSDSQRNGLAQRIVSEFSEFANRSTAVSELIADLSSGPAFFDWETQDVGALVAKKVLSFTY